MDEKNLVICDKELRYANGLGENVLARSELALRVHTCSTLDSLRQLSEEWQLHILIIDESFAYEERSKIRAEQTFVLTKDGCVDLGDGEHEVEKYQSADQILSLVFSAYYEKTSQSILKSVKKSKQNLLAVYSPIHRVGKTTFALALGRQLAKKEKTLYLNLEEYPDVDGRFAGAKGRNLGDLLYYLRQEEENVAMRSSSMIEKMGELDYVPPILISRDLKEVSYEEWNTLLMRLLTGSAYENIILDLSESVQGLFSLLQLCDRIYMPILDDEISKKKLNQYEQNLHQLGLGGLEDTTRRFVIPGDVDTYVKKLIQEEG